MRIVKWRYVHIICSTIIYKTWKLLLKIIYISFFRDYQRDKLKVSTEKIYTRKYFSVFLWHFLTDYRDIFLLFDKDDDGSITGAELGTVMRALGENPTEKELQALVIEADTDGEWSNSVDFDVKSTVFSFQVTVRLTLPSLLIWWRDARRGWRRRKSCSRHSKVGNDFAVHVHSCMYPFVVGWTEQGHCRRSDRERYVNP